jgi:hypothetical protein
MMNRFVCIFCFLFCAFSLEAQVETRAERSAQALSEQTPGKLFEQRLALLEQAIQSEDGQQMLIVQREILLAVRESMAQYSGGPSLQALEGALAALDNFSFHNASGAVRQAKLEMLRSVQALIR